MQTWPIKSGKLSNQSGRLKRIGRVELAQRRWVAIVKSVIASPLATPLITNQPRLIHLVLRILPIQISVNLVPHTAKILFRGYLSNLDIKPYIDGT